MKIKKVLEKDLEVGFSFFCRLSKFRAALHLCAVPMRRKFGIDESNLNDGKTFFERINNIAMYRHDIFLTCGWAGQNDNCKKFGYVMTERGPCFSFNVLDSADIYTDV